MQILTKELENLISQIKNKTGNLTDLIDSDANLKNLRYNEISIENAIKKLREYIDIIDKTISYIDEFPYSQKNALKTYLSNINNILTTPTNIRSSYINFIQYVDNLNNFIKMFSLDLIYKNYPDFTYKLQELSQLIEKEKEVINIIENNIDKIEEFEKIYINISNKAKDIDNLYQRISSLLDKSQTDINEINNKKSESNILVDQIRKLSSQAENLVNIIENNKNEIGKLKNDINIYKNELHNYQQKIENHLKNLENKINKHLEDTEDIIRTNKKQQENIEKLLTSAVGTNLFKSFNKRKEELEKGLKFWFWGTIFWACALCGIGIWIYSDLKSQNFELSKTLLKVASTFPLVYLLVFFTNRYSKDKNLLEEYAFKSTLSLSLKPYAKLIEEVEKQDTDKKYRDFLITSILQIFTPPTDKLYKNIKSDGLDVKEIIKSLNIFSSKEKNK